MHRVTQINNGKNLYAVQDQQRAEDLMDALSDNTKLNSIKVLQDHLGKNSTINNHSLDTYLLENILSRSISKKLTD